MKEKLINTERGMRMGNIKTRIDYYDIAKGIGIVAVVCDHSSWPLASFAQQFLMPFFFLISGLLYSDKTSVKEFAKKKFCSLYIPFAFWNLLFYIGKSIYHGVSLGKIIKHSGLILLTLEKDGQFLGATWFLGALFAVSLIYKILEYSLKRSKGKEVILFVIFGSMSLLGFEVTLPFKLSRTLILGSFYAVGAFYKRYKEHMDLFESKYKYAAIVSFLIFVLISSYNSASMGSNIYKSKILFIAGAAMMSYAVLYFCKFLAGRRAKIFVPIKKCFIYLGKHSMDILVWQFVFFRIVIIAQITLHNEPLTFSNILSYYPIYSSENGWWIVYVLTGVILPILWCNLLRFGIWGRLFKKMHIV